MSPKQNKPLIDPPMRVATQEEIRAVHARAYQLLSDGLEPAAVIDKLVEETGTSKENVENLLAAVVPPAPRTIVVETHQQAAELNANRTAEDGYVKVGDTVKVSR